MKAKVNSVNAGTVVFVGEDVKLKLKNVPEGSYAPGDEVELEVYAHEAPALEYTSPEADMPFKAYPAVPPTVIVDMPLLDSESDTDIGDCFED